MASLAKFLADKNYVEVSLLFTGTHHLEVDCSINDQAGKFIVDTGASSSCVDPEMVEYFSLFAEDSEVKAAGAGAINMQTQVSADNTLAIGDWQINDAQLVIFDLSHVNEALEQHNAAKVHGIIGADILQEADAIIDYQTEKLFLQPQTDL